MPNSRAEKNAKGDLLAGGYRSHEKQGYNRDLRDVPVRRKISESLGLSSLSRQKRGEGGTDEKIRRKEKKKKFAGRLILRIITDWGGEEKKLPDSRGNKAGEPSLVTTYLPGKKKGQKVVRTAENCGVMSSTAVKRKWASRK